MSKAKKTTLSGIWNNLSKPLRVLMVVVLIIAAACAYVAYQNGNIDDIINPNHAPEIVYAYPGLPTYQLVSDSNNLSYRITELRAGIIDKDGDKLTVMFWMRNSTSPWRGLEFFEGYNGTYLYKFPITYLISKLNHDNYEWRIDATDGKATTSRTYPMYIV